MIIDGKETQMKECCGEQMSIIKEDGDIELEDTFNNEILEPTYWKENKYYYICEICKKEILFRTEKEFL